MPAAQHVAKFFLNPTWLFSLWFEQVQFKLSAKRQTHAATV
ncbi:hypothetical protein GCWU000324_02886 [Kingella oralis ATCC 51147]|uniref:Uncharacterized protein n=1 Tax=Kingella oralis ATCC 51147 TaxID=629741 RepID=C4GMF1_9NEIS|nr:hypothetical protein GCWU000324_02886 [Kingella oralis ATCC 51147]